MDKKIIKDPFSWGEFAEDVIDIPELIKKLFSKLWKGVKMFFAIMFKRYRK